MQESKHKRKGSSTFSEMWRKIAKRQKTKYENMAIKDRFRYEKEVEDA